MDVHLVSLVTAFDDCLVDVARKVWIQYYVIVQMLFQVLSALIPTVPVVDSEDLNLRPFIILEFGLFNNRLYYIQDDRNSVLVSFSHEADVGIGCEWLNDAKSFVGGFRICENWKLAPHPHLHLLSYQVGRLVVLALAVIKSWRVSLGSLGRALLPLILHHAQVLLTWGEHRLRFGVKDILWRGMVQVAAMRLIYWLVRGQVDMFLDALRYSILLLAVVLW